MRKVIRQKSCEIQRARSIPRWLRFGLSMKTDSSPLDEIVRAGAQQMLQTAIDADVSQCLLLHDERRDERGNRLVIRNAYLPVREILTGAGLIQSHAQDVK